MITNCQITQRGRALARELSRYLGTTQRILEICSLVARHARTHHRLQETACNRELRAHELLQESHIERRIRDLVADLPHTDDGPITVRFQGDPRGYTVKLHVPGHDRDGNTWGLGGDYGV